MSDRASIINAFLADSTWQDWARVPLSGDASARQYLRLSSGPETAILMNAPPENGEDTRPFVEIATLLLAHGFAAPRVLAHDPENGVLLLSDLGASDFAGWLRQSPAEEAKLYQAAADILLRLEAIAPPPRLGRMTPAIGAQMVEIVGAHYSHASTGDLCTQMQDALAEFAPDPNTLALRDFHAENLIWRAGTTEPVGLLDFQDAFVAPPGYDLASLLRDARRDVSPGTADHIISYFAERSRAKAPFRTSLACLGVQRNLRILGVFARLATEIGKPRYLDFMPRIWGHIVQDLQDPALDRLKQAVMDTVPAPTPATLARLVA